MVNSISSFNFFEDGGKLPKDIRDEVLSIQNDKKLLIGIVRQIDPGADSLSSCDLDSISDGLKSKAQAARAALISKTRRINKLLNHT